MYREYVGSRGSLPAIMENEKDQTIENEMDTGVLSGLWLTCNPKYLQIYGSYLHTRQAGYDEENEVS